MWPTKHWQDDGILKRQLETPCDGGNLMRRFEFLQSREAETLYQDGNPIPERMLPFSGLRNDAGSSG